MSSGLLIKHRHMYSWTIVFLALLGVVSSLGRAETILIDFGDSTSYRGASVKSPDKNGNHWNLFRPGDYKAGLVNTKGVVTSLAVGLDPSGKPVGTDSYNGPAGATSDPLKPEELDAAVFESIALGSLGVKEAVVDYIVSKDGRIQIQGLDPSLTYQIDFFASRRFADNPSTAYTAYSDSSYSNPVSRATLNVQSPASPWLHNRGNVASIFNLKPQQGNILYISFGGEGGVGGGSLNALRISTEGSVSLKPDAASSEVDSGSVAKPASAR
jgi:hypothetical protein